MLRGFDDLGYFRGYLVQLDDVGVPDQLQNVDFSGDTLYIGDVHYSLLLQNLYRHQLACEVVRRQLHDPERPLPDCLPQKVVPDFFVGLLRGVLLGELLIRCGHYYYLYDYNY